MKKLLSFLTLMLLASQVNSQDYYYYKGKRIELQVRPDKIAFVTKINYPETEVRANVLKYLNTGDEIKKAGENVYIVNFSSAKTPSEETGILSSLATQSNLIKLTTNVYYGTSKSVTQIPSDRIIVKLKKPSDIDKLNSFNVINKCKIISESGNGVYIISSDENVKKNALVLSDIFYSSNLFEYAEPDFIYPEKCLLLSVPNDPSYPKQWALKNSGQLLQTGSSFLVYGDASTVNGIPGADMNVEAAWNLTTGSPEVKIGIIDTGIDSLHPDFQYPGHLLPGYDAFNDVNSSAVDVGNHGTSTAGLIGAVMNNSIGIAGIASSCPIMSICIFDINGSSTSSVIARAFDTARARGIDVLSNSWGGGTPEAAITDAIDNAAINGRNGLGCVILFASGNDGNNPPLYPSVLPNVLSIGGSTPHDQAKSPGTGNQFFWGSNYGENEIGDIDAVAPTNCATLLSGGDYENNFWGTSATCPNAAGVAALVLSVNTTQSRLQVYDNLLRGCDKIDNVPYDNQKSFGLWSKYYGYGRINALNSVMLALGTDITPPSISHLNVSSHSSTYPTKVTAKIVDQNGNAVPVTGDLQPKLFYKIKKGTGAWSGYDSLTAVSNSGNDFTFSIPSEGWETQVKYYIRAFDNYGNKSTFPAHAPNEFWLCYFAVGNLTTEVKKVPGFRGADMGATLSNSVAFTNFTIVNSKIQIYMRHTYLNDEVIQVFAPFTDANNSRKCLFASNGGDGDNITGACVYDTASAYWAEGTPPFLYGNFKPEYNMRGYNGMNATGNWRILHFDRGVTDYAFFDSVKILLSRTTGTSSSCVRLNLPSDSIINFGPAAFPDIVVKNFYIKNSGTSNLNISGYSIEGNFTSMFSILNTPPTSILPNDSGLFTVKLNTQAGSGNQGFENAVLKVLTNDPGKPVFKVSLLTNDPLHYNLKNLNLKMYIEGTYNADSNKMVSDSVIVYLRSSSAPYDLVDSCNALVGSNGTGSFNFANSSNNIPYYIVIKHRNAIETWSSVPVSFVSSFMNYDFTISASQAYGENMILKGDKYCLYSGDVNSDGAIDANDIGQVGNSAYQYQQGYLNEDLNGDYVIDATDTHIADNNGEKFVMVIRP